VRGGGVQVLGDGCALALEVAFDRRHESRVRQPVRGLRERGFEATRELVLALGAGVEGVESVRDAVLDALVSWLPAPQ